MIFFTKHQRYDSGLRRWLLADKLAGDSKPNLKLLLALTGRSQCWHVTSSSDSVSAEGKKDHFCCFRRIWYSKNEGRRSERKKFSSRILYVQRLNRRIVAYQIEKARSDDLIVALERTARKIFSSRISGSNFRAA